MASRKDHQQAVLLSPSEYASKASFQVVRCRAGQHDWPTAHLAPGKPLPSGIQVWKFPDGFVQLIETCAACEKSRDTWLAPGGLMGEELDRGYKDPKGWIRVPRSVGMTKHDWRKAFFQMVSTDLMSIARPIGEDGEI